MPSAQYLVIAFVAACCVVAVARFELMCFKDLAGRSDQELNHLTRAGWAVVIAVVIPVGGIFYLGCGRPR